MNIFVLDQSPTTSAKMLCDKHIPKMLLESVQMLSCALISHNCPEDELPITKSGQPYRGGYKHHPCSVWTGQSRNNYLWLIKHAYQIAQEYVDRFNNSHACIPALARCFKAYKYLPPGSMSPFVLAMPDEFKVEDPVTSYRNYYKSKTFAKWQKTRKEPHWWNEN